MALTEVNSLGIKDSEVKTADIAAANVTLAKVENVTDGQIIVGNGSNRPTAVAVSGDVTLANTGAVTIAAGAVEHAMLAGDAVDGDNIADDVINSEHIAAGAVDLEHMSSESVDEDNLHISNAGSNGQFLSKQSGNSGGLTWASVSSTPEGTAILSTGESGGTKFLREDGDGSSSWQSVPAAGATINNATVNELVTVASTTTQLDAESTLLYDSSASQLTMKPADGHTDIIKIVPNDDSEKCKIVYRNAADNDDEAYISYEHDTNQFRFLVNSHNYRGMVIDSNGRIQNGTGTDPSGNGAVDPDPDGCSSTEHGWTTNFGIAQNSNSTAWTDSLFGVIISASMNGFNSTQSASLIGINMANGAVEPGDMIRCYRNTTLNFRIAYDGDVTNEDNSYGSISDETLKQDIVDAGSQWNDVKAVKVRKFRFKKSVQEAADLNASSDNDRTDLVAPTLLGVIAQELETAGMNGLVDQDREKLNPKTVKYSILYMKAFKALQEAMAKIEVLETKVAALEAG